MNQTRPPRLPALAFTEWIMVLPASVFLAAAALRLLQPREYEPSRTSWIIFEWTQSHVSRLGAAALFLVLPGLAALVGSTILVRAWRLNERLRDGATQGLKILRQNLAALLLTGATVAAAVIFVFALLHVLTD